MKIVPIEVSPAEGRIILMCKGHYKTKSIMDGIRRLWAARCGIDAEHTIKGQSDEYIANDLFALITKVSPNTAERMVNTLHAELQNPYNRYE